MNRRNFIHTLLAAFTLLALPWAPRSPAADTTPVQVIEKFQDTLLTVMKNAAKLGYQGRHKTLAPVVTTTLDLPTIARIALGQYWGQLSANQRTHFVATFTNLSVATYAARFDGYDGETFTAPTMRDLPGGDVLVQSALVKSDGGKVQFAYQMRKLDGQWRVINIIADGVSDLALKRAEYTSVIKNNNFDTLLDRLKQQTTAYERHGKDAKAPTPA
ncbi:MAG: ABC transporter substrate-binding protein [Gammaproteobacteria bacterium]